MNHAYLIEIKEGDNWKPFQLLLATYDEFNALMSKFGRIDNLRWRRLHGQGEFDYHREHCEFRTAPRLNGCTQVEWS